MTIQPIGFLETSGLTAMYVLKHRDKLENGILRLRDVKDDDADPSDLPILREWKSARALLSRLRAAAALFFNGVTPELGKAWIEVLPPMSGTPWSADDGDYSERHIRTRTCLIPAPMALSYCGGARAELLVGMVNQFDLRLLSSEVNLGEHTRVHLVVDVRVPDAPAET